MDGHRETPDTRLEQYLLIAIGLGILFAGDLLVLRIKADPAHTHPAEFLLLALLAALLLYLAWLFLGMQTVRYHLDGGHLHLHQLLRRPLVLRLDAPLGLHRWRYRWGWSGGAEKDLGVEEIDHFPPLWAFGSSKVWVLVGQTAGGDRHAVALRPSPRLLALLKETVAERRAMHGD